VEHTRTVLERLHSKKIFQKLPILATFYKVKKLVGGAPRRPVTYFKWDVQLWGFGSLFLSNLMHCLAERPKKIKIIYF
jgi:hypothetical protein